MEACWLRFQDGLHKYVLDFVSQGAKFGNKKLIVPEINYTIETSIPDNWQFEIAKGKSINDLTPEIKAIAIQYLPVFLDKYPQYKSESCLKTF